MKSARYLILCSCLMACSSSEKKSENISADTLNTDAVIIQEDTVAVDSASADEPEIAFTTISIGDNEWLREFIRTPFAVPDIDSLIALLNSKSIPIKYNAGEYGSLMFDRSSIFFNRSYGEAICTAEIRSPHIPISKGIMLVMGKSDFLQMISFVPSAADADTNEQYEYAYKDIEHTFIVRFDFVENVLTRFYYEKDPCVILD